MPVIHILYFLILFSMFQPSPMFYAFWFLCDFHIYSLGTFNLLTLTSILYSLPFNSSAQFLVVDIVIYSSLLFDCFRISYKFIILEFLCIFYNKQNYFKLYVRLFLFMLSL